MKSVIIVAIIFCVTYNTLAIKDIFPLNDAIRDLSHIKAVDRTPPEIKEQLKNLNGSKYSTRILGGKPSRKNQFPYQTFLLCKFVNGIEYCSGSLITQNYVLTAAHCVHGAMSVDMHFGSIDRLFENDVKSQILINKNSIFIHENYNPKFVHNDIALLKLPYPVELSESVQPVKLVDESFNTKDITGIAAGWGLTNNDSGLSNILRHVNLKVIPIEECVNKYPSNFIQPTNLCTHHSSGRTTCRGDSGGALVFKHKDHYVQFGIISFGDKKTCENGIPAVHTKISSYVNWIKKHMGCTF